MDWVGRIPRAIEIEWQYYPGGRLNQDFLRQLERYATRELILMFICRSSYRSHDAACLAADAGFAACYNVLDGFEGEVDGQGLRGRLGGWRFSGLPWHS